MSYEHGSDLNLCQKGPKSFGTMGYEGVSEISNCYDFVIPLKFQMHSDIIYSSSHKLEIIF